MKKSVQIISIFIFSFFFAIIAGFGFLFYIAIKHFSDYKGAELVFNVSLFLLIGLLIFSFVGVAASVGLFRLKNWGRRLFNLVVAYGLLIHITQVIARKFPEYYDYTIVDFSNGAIFYHNDYGWMGQIIPILSIIIFLLLNSNRCKSIMSS